MVVFFQQKNIKCWWKPESKLISWWGSYSISVSAMASGFWPRLIWHQTIWLSPDKTQTTSYQHIIKTLFCTFHGSVQRLSVPICRESRIFNTQGSNIDIILLCQTSFHRRDNIRPTRSFFLLPFHRAGNKFKEYFLPFQLWCKSRYLWPNPDQFCAEVRKDRDESTLTI